MMEEKKNLKITKIDKEDKKDKLDIQGQSCWNDCKVWSGYTTTPKCECSLTAQTSIFL